MRLSGNPAVKVRCVTNNPLVKERYPASEFHGVGTGELFLIARRLMAAGHALLTHPLYGNIRPDVGPYKSVLLEQAINPVDLHGLQLITSAISYTEQLVKSHAPPRWDAASLRDFQEVDCSILGHVLEQ